MNILFLNKSGSDFKSQTFEEKYAFHLKLLKYHQTDFEESKFYK
jgi:hypothetical protein